MGPAVRGGLCVHRPPRVRVSPHVPVGRRAGVKALVRGCPPDAVVSLAHEAVGQS